MLIRINTLFRVLILTTASIVASLPAIAERQPTPEQRRELEQYRKEKHKQNFTGWKGVLFHCSVEEQPDSVVTEICEKSYTDAAFLAAAANVNLENVKSSYEFGLRSALDDFLALELDLSATKSGALAAVHANLRAYVSYLKAIETTLHARERNGPRATARSGDLILWRRSMIDASSGNARELVIPVSQSIEQCLKQFLADFVNAQR